MIVNYVYQHVTPLVHSRGFSHIKTILKEIIIYDVYCSGDQGCRFLISHTWRYTRDTGRRIPHWFQIFALMWNTWFKSQTVTKFPDKLENTTIKSKHHFVGSTVEFLKLYTPKEYIGYQKGSPLVDPFQTSRFAWQKNLEVV